jgi:hypothetical protein
VAFPPELPPLPPVVAPAEPPFPPLPPAPALPAEPPTPVVNDFELPPHAVATTKPRDKRRKLLVRFFIGKSFPRISSSSQGFAF